MSTTTIKFKEPFESQLKELRIKTKFIYNVRHGKGVLQMAHKSMKERIRILNNTSNEDWATFINQAFRWNSTPEGYLFWHNILLAPTKYKYKDNYF